MATRDRTLNDIMEIGHVIRVQGGIVHDDVDPRQRELWAPELYWEGDTYSFQPYTPDHGWTLLDGYSGQYLYTGPIMHPSEFVGGRMADDILARDGYYVALVCDDLGDPEDEDAESEPVGWAVAYRPLPAEEDPSEVSP